MSTPVRAALSALLLAACTPSAPPAAPSDAVLPSFAPATELAGTAPTSAPASTPSDVPTAATATDTDAAAPSPVAPVPPPATTPAPPPADEGAGVQPTGTITDPGGDVRAGTPLQEPPGYVDLRSLALTREEDGYEVRVELDAPAPERRDGERITNIATFYDVDGDGELDYQVYATSTPDGWGSAYFDHVAGESRYADDDEVDVTVEDGAVVMRFPLAHLGGADRLQWSAASQWGTFEELQTGTEARDRAPDDGHGVLWPTTG